MARLVLPTNQEDLVEALTAEIAASEVESNLQLINWKIIDSYLAGARRFRMVDRWSGDRSIGFENAKGEIDLRYEDIVRRYHVEVGRYLKGDFTPVVSRKGDSLGALRKAGISQAILTAASSKLPLRKIKKRLITQFLKYGTVGLAHYETGDEVTPDMFDVVNPRQLRGLPAWCEGEEMQWGICRRRWVPLHWITQRLQASQGKKLTYTDPIVDLEARDVPWGSVAPGYSIYEDGGGSGGMTYTMPSVDIIGELGERGSNRRSHVVTDKPERMVDAEGRMFVPLDEVYIYDDTGEFVSRYIMKIGRRIPIDINFEEMGVKVLCPLHIARHTDTGRFFARGFVGPLIPFNDQIERMMGSLFKNIMELDMFGTLFVSDGMNIDLKRWRTGPRPKVEKYNTDPISPAAAPFNLTPANSGMAPARIVEFGTGVMDRLAGQGALYSGDAPGRTESAASLGMLFNTGNTGIILPADNLANTFSGAYARLLQSVRDRSKPGDAVELALVSDAVAGVVLNPETGVLELSNNPIPNPWEVAIDVKDRSPRDPDIRKQELREEFAAGRVDQTRYWITALEENLDIPGAPRDLWETWRKAQYQIVSLFRDGKTPGVISLGEHNQNPQIQLLAVQQFMNKIEYSLAAPEVRRAFEQWKESLEGLAGLGFPAGLMPPEDAAAQQMQMMQQQQQMGQM